MTGMPIRDSETKPLPLRRRQPFLIASIATAVVVAGLILRWAGQNSGDATWGDVFGMCVVASAGLALLGSTIRPLRPIMFGLAAGTMGGFLLSWALIVVAIMRLGDV